MSTARSILDYLAAPCLSEDGEERGTLLMQPLSEAEIVDLERLYGCRFTDDVKELLLYCGGLEEGPMEFIDFKGEEVDFILPSLRDRFRAISHDGFGNFWFYWTSHVGPELGPVFYYQHEGPMLFYQSDNIGDFVRECIRFMTPPYQSLIDDVHEFRLRPIRSLNDDLLTLENAAVQTEHDLAEFAKHFPSDVRIYDFRRSKVGDGVDLAKLSVVALHPKLPVLAVRERPSLFRWLIRLIRGKQS